MKIELNATEINYIKEALALLQAKVKRAAKATTTKQIQECYSQQHSELQQLDGKLK